MSIWATRRKQRIAQNAAPAVTPRDDLEIRVARRICAAAYARGCQCSGHTNGHPNVCDTMRLAAQHALDEILNGAAGGL